MVPAGVHMEIRELSRVRTPFSTFFMHDRIGTPVNWVLSAVGRAYLAYCPEKERERILAPLRKSGKTEDGLAGDLKRLDRILAETRMKGYGVRDQSFVGGAYGRHSPDGLAGIAQPLPGCQAGARGHQHHSGEGGPKSRRDGPGPSRRSTKCGERNCGVASESNRTEEWARPLNYRIATPSAPENDLRVSSFSSISCWIVRSHCSARAARSCQCSTSRAIC